MTMNISQAFMVPVHAILFGIPILWIVSQLILCPLYMFFSVQSSDYLGLNLSSTITCKISVVFNPQFVYL